MQFLYLFLKLIRKLPGMVIKLVKIPDPSITEGFDCRGQIGELCRSKGFRSVLVVTDKTLFGLGYHQMVTDSLAANDIQFRVFSDIASEPNLTIVDAGRAMAAQCEAECIVAIGGGSVMDSCKMIAAGARLRRWKSSSLLLKFLYVPGQTLPLITVPSTAGTGAEMTVGAIVIGKNGAKNSTVLLGLNVPNVFLDSALTINAPQSVTAACAIDALSHGLEGCVADVKVPDEDMQKSRECVKLVLNNLPIVLNNPHDVDARQAMCRAANYGGNAINKQLAGYVHAFAHSIGAMYHIPHGNAIALSLLPVMEYQKKVCASRLAEVAVYCNLAESDDPQEVAADKLLQAVRQLISDSGLSFTYAIKETDFAELAKRILMDAINYSAPVVMNKDAVISILRQLQPAA